MKTSLAPYSFQPTFSGKYTPVKADDFPELMHVRAEIVPGSEHPAYWMQQKAKETLTSWREVKANGRQRIESGDAYERYSLEERRLASETATTIERVADETVAAMKRILPRLQAIVKAPD